MSHEHQGVSFHWPLNCLLKSFYQANNKWPSKLWIISPYKYSTQSTSNAEGHFKNVPAMISAIKFTMQNGELLLWSTSPYAIAFFGP